MFIMAACATLSSFFDCTALRNASIARALSVRFMDSPRAEVPRVFCGIGGLSSDARSRCGASGSETAEVRSSRGFGAGARAAMGGHVTSSATQPREEGADHDAGRQHCEEPAPGRHRELEEEEPESRGATFENTKESAAMAMMIAMIAFAPFVLFG